MHLGIASMLDKNLLSALQGLTRLLKSGQVSNSQTIIRRFILQLPLIDTICYDSLYAYHIQADPTFSLLNP